MDVTYFWIVTWLKFKKILFPYFVKNTVLFLFFLMMATERFYTEFTENLKINKML